MICPTCRGRQFVSLGGADEDEGAGRQPCPDCIGGIASCCDAAGSYRDDVYPERLCDRCASLYRGPAVYCSLECAIADA